LNFFSAARRADCRAKRHTAVGPDDLSVPCR
jgi:hypothetical protein